MELKVSLSHTHNFNLYSLKCSLADAFENLFVFSKFYCTDYFTYAMKFVDTKNELTEEVGGYQHVVVLQNMKVVDGDLVDVLKWIPRGTVSGDCIQHSNGVLCSFF